MAPGFVGGGQIAFYAYRSESRNLWTMPSSGGMPRQITTGTASDAGPSWSQDEESLVFYSNRNGTQDIWLVRLDDLSLRSLTNDGAANRFPRFSPDGRSISFSSTRSGGGLWLTDPSGKNFRRLTPGPANYAVWSPDVSQLFFTRPRGDSDDIWTVGSNGGKEQPVTDFSGRRGRLGREALATDGQFLYFSWEDDTGDIWVMDVEWR